MTDKTDKTDKEEAKPTEAPFPIDGSTTEHKLKLDGSRLSYRAIAEWMTLRKIHKPVAHIFHTAYLADGFKDGDRPITFVFNGGPGAASAYLHMGALGPKRVAFGSKGSIPQPPLQVVDNLETWLAFTDLVFIDPVGTGFSRALEDPPKGDKAKAGDAAKPNTDPKENPEYWEIEKDLESLGEFINRFLSRHHRWTSPMFIAGESYGGFRVAKMAKKLQEEYGVGLSGALLISPAIEMEALEGTDYDLTYWVELLPSMAAAAHHHGLARNQEPGTSLDDVLRKAEAFATGDFSRWMAQGDAMPADERARIVKTMSDMTGLTVAFLERSAGRVTSTTFCRELLRDKRMLCGHYDASAVTVDPFPDRNNYEGPDPTLASIDRLFTGAVNHHLRAHLGVATDLEYRLLSMHVHMAWKDKNRDYIFRKLTGAMDDLRYGMSLNEHMRVFITHGHFDLVTPYFSSGRLLNLMKLTPEQRQNVTVKNFHGGHMFYSWDDSRVAFRDEIRKFYQLALAPAEPFSL